MHIVPKKKQQETGAVTLRDAMSQLFDEAFWDPWRLLSTKQLTMDSRCFVPNMDISEDEKHFRVVADVPGYDPKGIEVTIDENVLTLQGRMQQEKEEEDKKEKWYRKECSSGGFYQQFTLPSHVDAAAIRCKAKNGKLTVTIPKKEKEAKPAGKRLEVEVE